MQPHCARLVVAGRRRDRDDPHALRARETVKRRSGPPSHGPPSPRRGTASPPPTHPVYTAAPSVEGSSAKLGCYSKVSKTVFRKCASTKPAFTVGRAKPPLGAGRLAYVNVTLAQAAKLGCESGDGEPPLRGPPKSVSQARLYVGPSGGAFVPKPLPSQPGSVHSRAAQAALFLRRGSRRANRLFLALLPGQVGHPPILNPASAAMLTMSASVEPSETI